MHVSVWPQSWVIIDLFSLSERSLNVNFELSYATSCWLNNTIAPRHSCVFTLIMRHAPWVLLKIRETKGLILWLCMTGETGKRKVGMKTKRFNLHQITYRQRTTKWSGLKSQKDPALLLANCSLVEVT